MIRLLAHAAPPGCIDLWLGASEVMGVDGLAWTLDGAPVEPEVLRPVEAVRIGDAAPSSELPRVFTGGFRLRLDGPGPYTVEVRADGQEPATLTTSPVPRELPEGRWFNVLLGSCYDRYMEKAPHLASRVVARLCEDPDTRPDLSLFMGDQVYLDVPPTDVIGRFGEPGLRGITAQFEGDYRLTWMDHLHGVLAAAPFICVPDDHEFWNNYPTQVAWLPRTVSRTGRAEWEQAARRCYDAFQRPVGLDDPAVLDIGPLSLFCLDTRTWRAVDRSRCADPDHLDALRAWARRVHDEQRLPVFMTGQTLFKPAVSPVRGWLTDYELANYGDYVEILQALHQAGSIERPTVCLTGDVHFGRVVQAVDEDGHPRMYEIISSPLSLCSDPRSAHQPLLSQAYQRLFGEAWLSVNRPWPRHPRPALARRYLPVATDGSAHLRCVNRYSHAGNQLALLGFRRHPTTGALRVRIGYVSLVADERRWEPVWVGPFDLRAGVDVFRVIGSVLQGAAK